MFFICAFPPMSPSLFLGREGVTVHHSRGPETDETR
jgi:hypothetical protein